MKESYSRVKEKYVVPSIAEKATNPRHCRILKRPGNQYIHRKVKYTHLVSEPVGRLRRNLVAGSEEISFHENPKSPLKYCLTHILSLWRAQNEVCIWIQKAQLMAQ